MERNNAGNGSAVDKHIDEELFRLLIANVKDYAIFMVDPNGYVMSWNQGACNIKGYTESEIKGRHISVFYTQADIAAGEPSNNLASALKKGSHESEGWRVRKDGSLFWANVVLTTVYDDSGHLLGVAKVTCDITERKRNEDRQQAVNARLAKQLKDNTKKIIANEQRFRQLIEHSYDGITLFNHNYEPFYRSLSAEHITGWTDWEIANMDKDVLIHPQDKDEVSAVFAEASKKAGVPVKTLFRCLHKDGHYMWLDCVCTNWFAEEHISAIVCNYRDVSESIKSSEEIKRKTAQVENILESITDGFIALDNNFCYTYANKKIGEMLGCDAQVLIGHYVWSEFPEAIGSDTYKAFNTAFEKQQYICHEDYYAPLNLWQENHIYPSPQGLSVFIKDITERKHNEELQQKHHEILQEASATQAAILNALPPNIALLNEQGKIIAVNESWKKFVLLNNLGLPNYGVGYNYLAYCEKAMGIKNDGNKVAKGIKAVINGRKNSYTLEYPFDLPNEKRWYQLVAAPLQDNKHKGAVVLHINITDRKLAEASLVQSEANLRSVFENPELAIVLFDADLKIISFNTNARELSIRNYGKKLKRGRSAFNYFPLSRKSFITRIADSINAGETYNYEATFDLTGITEWYDVNWTGVINPQNKNIGFILTLKNITEKKLADIEREKMTADLVKRNADLEQFTYIISHNLRAPVANIMGLSGLLDNLNVESEEDRHVLKSLSASVHKLDSVILDLNHMLQVNSQVNGNILEIDLADIVGDILASIEYLVTREEVVVNIDFKVPAIFTLRNYLHSIFYNLLINSIKYRRPGVPPVINISSFMREHNIIITFKDNGKGIDLERNGKHLFGLYKRFDHSVEGKGMGLFMVKMQVENLGGSISIKSEPGKGAEFEMEFPAAPAVF